MSELPVLPYADSEAGSSSDWSGSETSAARAHHQDSSGGTENGQTRVLDFLRLRGGLGCTWREVAEELGVHHGTASGLLSNLHSAGLILRLVEVRERSKVYVHPPFRYGRDIEEPKQNLNARKMATLRRIVRQADERGLDSLPLDLIRQIVYHSGEKP